MEVRELDIIHTSHTAIFYTAEWVNFSDFSNFNDYSERFVCFHPILKIESGVAKETQHTNRTEKFTRQHPIYIDKLYWQIVRFLCWRNL
jgi:hypothetical protein